MIFSNSKLAVDISNSRVAWNGHHGALVHQIRHMLSMMEMKVVHIPRDMNACAHWLSRNGLFQPFGLHHFMFPPSPLMHLLYLNKLNFCNHSIPPLQVRAFNKA